MPDFKPLMRMRCICIYLFISICVKIPVLFVYNLFTMYMNYVVKLRWGSIPIVVTIAIAISVQNWSSILDFCGTLIQIEPQPNYSVNMTIYLTMTFIVIFLLLYYVPVYLTPFKLFTIMSFVAHVSRY